MSADRLPPKLLLDEDVSPQVANRLCARGIDATHVRNRNMLGAADHEVLKLAFDDDRVLVTANVADFIRLAKSVEVHAGIILLLDGDLRRGEQSEVIDKALEAIVAEDRDMLNRTLSISRDGDPIFALCSVVTRPRAAPVGRPHRGLHRQPPAGERWLPPPRPPPGTLIVAQPVLGGLHHKYGFDRRAA